MARNEYTERVLSRRLRSLDDRGRLDLARETVEHLGNQFDEDVCSLILEDLEGIRGPLLQDWLNKLADTPNGVWLRTQLLSEPASVARSWERFLSFRVRREPFDLLALAHALAAAGAHEESAANLRLALSQDVGYTMFARAERLVRTLARSTKSNLRQCRIAVLGSSTTNLFTPVLEALCFRDRIGADIYEAPYGSIEQEIRGASDALARFRPDIVVLVMHWRDLGLNAEVEDEEKWIDDFIEERKGNWKRLSDLFGCHIVQPSFDYPSTEPYGYLSDMLRGGRSRVIDLLNLRLRQEAPANVSILNMEAVQREIGSRGWEDESSWTRYRQHPSTEALPALAEAYMSHVRAVLGLSRKVLVVDLDNTIWGGVIGEDGLNGIKIGPDNPEGEAYLNFQRYMLDLKRRGVLLAVCSKNNIEDAHLPFLRHPLMVLRLDDFAAFRANWEDKATNLKDISRQLSLGLDSFVFVDDNPLEREWVRSQLPEVAVIEVGSSPFHFLRQLHRGRYFEALRLSREDLIRADGYRVEAQREILRASSSSIEEFLQKLGLEAKVESVTERNLARVTQLVNKTNQFNVTTRRYTEAQICAISRDPQGWAGAFHLTDRMANYGLIGVLLCRPAGVSGVWEIDTWLMSCRALGRQMEKFMFDRLIEAAIARQVRQLLGTFCPTSKNGLVKDLYDQMGFRRIFEGTDQIRYEFNVPSVPTLTASHIRNATA